MAPRTLICKLLQRKTYDVLSRKYTILFLFLGVVVVTVSLLHFGETLLEWSTEKYGAMFYPFSDNIAGKSFHKMLCQHVPIDIVYTWVNGSDPKHLHGLAHAKEEYGFTQMYTNSCSLGLCVESHMVLLRPDLPKSITLSDLEEADPSFAAVTDTFAVSSPYSSQSNTTVLVFSSIDEAKQASKKSVITIDGSNYTVFLAFVTDNWSSQNTVPLKNTFIVLNVPTNISEQQLVQKLPSSVRKSVKNVYLNKNSHISILTTLINVMLNGTDKSSKKSELSISSAYLVVEFSSEHEDVSASRFTDNEELRYSLRSVEKHAPWVQHIYIVTNGQIPYWLNLDNPRVTIVTHEEIFPNKSHLPTFSSPAIECHLHRIPNLSKKFLYLNDDVMFGKDVWPEDFYSHTKGHKVYLSWPVPNCAEGCPSSWIRDGYCDKPCNNSMCQWDGGDCTADNPLLPYHGMFSQPPGGTELSRSPLSACNEECINSWLADRYCDKACNVRKCGFDLGDCGTGNHHQIPQLVFSQSKVDYQLPEGETVGYFNLTELTANNFTLKDAFHEDHPVVRAMAVAVKHNVLTFALHPNYNKTKIKITLKSEGWMQFPDVVFYLTVSTREKFVPASEKPVSNHSHEESIEPIIFEEFSDEEKQPKILPLTEDGISGYGKTNISASGLPQEIISQVYELMRRLVAGELTEKGYWKKKAFLINEFVKSHESAHNESLALVYGKEYDLKEEVRSLIRTLNSSQSKDQLVEFLITQEDVARTSPLSASNYTKTASDSSGLKTKSHAGTGSLWDRLLLTSRSTNHTGARNLLSFEYETPPLQRRQLLDTFGDSLRHANKLYNEAFGYEARKVPSHIAHFIDKDVMFRLYERFQDAFDVTSSHRIRSSNDMQFAFSYYYYLMSEPESVNLEDVFDEFDVDRSGTWSDREIRTLLTRVNDLPLDYSVVTEFEQNIINCSKTFSPPSEATVSTPHYERYYDSKLPIVTKSLVLSCAPVTTMLVHNFGQRKRNMFEIVGEEEVAFKMIHNNLSHVLGQIDDIRKHPKKFVCLNDNMKHGTPEAEMIRAVIQDFYESLFPKRSQFELPPDYRNRFLYMNELQEWRRMRDVIRFATYLCLGLLIIFSATSFWSAEVRPEVSRRRLSTHHRRRPCQV